MNSRLRTLNWMSTTIAITITAIRTWWSWRTITLKIKKMNIKNAKGTLVLKFYRVGKKLWQTVKRTLRRRGKMPLREEKFLTFIPSSLSISMFKWLSKTSTRYGWSFSLSCKFFMTTCNTMRKWLRKILVAIIGLS